SALFSATMPTDVAGLAAGFLKDPVRVEVAPQATTVERIDQRVEPTETAAKRRRLVELVTTPGTGRTIVFARTKRGADRVAQNLVKDGVPAEVIHGNKAQNARQRALNAFRNGQVRVLVATDIVARGIDVPGVTHVINYDLPDEPEAYVHRIGRTGRNGADGTAITLCAPDELKKLRAVEKITRTTLLPGGPAERAQPRSEPQAAKPKAQGRRPQGQRKPKAEAPSPQAPAASLDPARAERARNRRPRRTQRAA
ncbi:MAG TPA: DEAD/DEAH box helicase, partial [Amaricoccus sp.]|uniref:DEAD/DEAH box helicase n=1 Tax=Amaricoccus sp. TaxID=1872485 RepID=UPI002C0E64C7